MMIPALTGGIACGKSTAAAYFERLGCRIVDTDLIAREVVAPGQPAADDLRTAFGPDFFEPDGSLNRRRLAEHVFTDSAARAQLNALLHPRIRTIWLDRARTIQKRGETPLVVIPLLLETQAERECAPIICVACSPTLQRARLLERGLSAHHIEARIASQWPLATKIDRSDLVIWNDGPLDLLERQVLRTRPHLIGTEP